MRNIALMIATANKYADENQKSLYKKFPTTHWLSKPQNVLNLLLWNTFFRRNLHRLAIDYLKINLHIYQAIMLYLMGICQFIVVIASRAAAKSFIIALYACCRCITRPHTQIVLSSGTKGQSKLIVTVKIKNELMGMSPALRNEIKSIKDNQNEVIIYFKNGSTITVVPASENGRGHRSQCCIREEFRQIEKKIDDSILSPFQTVRQAPYMLVEPYASKKDLQEDPTDVYISSSWLDNGHWMWDIVSQAQNDMFDEKLACLLAFDESITLKHNIKTLRQLKREKKKQDPLTWRIEFLNERVKENSQAFFSYNMLMQNQVLRKAFYPRSHFDVKAKRKNPYDIPKQDGEVRIVSCDMAFVDNKGNDNSVFSCIRGLPEVITHHVENEGSESVVIERGYRRTVPYVESHKGGDTGKQALRIRQLYEDWSADYIVLDTRNAGISIYDLLAKIMYDEERDCEYAPLTCMNNDSIADRIKIPGAKPVIYAIVASQKLNSDIAFDMQTCLNDKRIDFLINYSKAQDEILSEIKDYKEDLDGHIRLLFETPFIETQLLISEMANLLYEKLEQTGTVKVFEQGSNTKDRYTSVSYGSWFLSQLEKDLFHGKRQKINVDSILSFGRRASIYKASPTR